MDFFIGSRVKLDGNHDQTLTLHFDSLVLTSKSDKTMVSYPLYSYHSIDLVVLFVYGADFTREMNILFVPRSIQLLISSILLFKISAVIILYIIRRKFQLRRNDFMSALIDTMVAFTAGGNLRMGHKLERIFFGILLIGNFFIISLFSGDLLDCFYRILDQKVSTFEQLATMNPTI